MEQCYGSGMRDTDFAGDPDASRQTINEWAKENTRGKIKELLPPQSIDGRTRIVIVNAIFFQGKWNQQFDKLKTREDDFALATDRTVRVPMMVQSAAHIRHADASTFSLIELSYTGGRWCMVFLLPKKRCGLREVETLLTGAMLNDALADLKSVERTIVIPRFKMNWNVGLKPALVGMGMPTAFSSAANFSGMIENTQLLIDDVIHGASIEVDESGTIAAAATAVKFRETAGPAPYRLDQPFIALVRDNHTGTIAFMTRVSDPR